MLRVEELMTNEPITINTEEDLESAYNLMDLHGFRHLPVVNQDGDVQGIISDRDLIREVLYTDNELPNSMTREMMKNIKVVEIMTREVESVEPTDDVRDAGAKMLESKISCLPVVSGTELVGILTESDFVRYLVTREE